MIAEMLCLDGFWRVLRYLIFSRDKEGRDASHQTFILREGTRDRV
jgi:hypothetical protein